MYRQSVKQKSQSVTENWEVSSILKISFCEIANKESCSDVTFMPE